MWPRRWRARRWRSPRTRKKVRGSTPGPRWGLNPRPLRRQVQDCLSWRGLGQSPNLPSFRSHARGDPSMPSDIPAIDMSPLRDGTGEARRQVATELGRACREVGFFSCTGHGITPDILAELLPPRATFSRYRTPQNAPSRSRVSATTAAISASARSGSISTPSLTARRPSISGGRWRRTMLHVTSRSAGRTPGRTCRAGALMPRYDDACLALGIAIHRGFSLDLGLPEDFFDDKLDRPLATLRLLRYPARTAATMARPAPASTPITAISPSWRSTAWRAVRCGGATATAVEQVSRLACCPPTATSAVIG